MENAWSLPGPQKPSSPGLPSITFFPKQQKVHRSDLGPHPVPPILGSVILACYLISLSLEFLIGKMRVTLSFPHRLM